ncbi:c-type cytochrome [Sphingomonas sp. MMS24-JH45]
MGVTLLGALIGLAPRPLFAMMAMHPAPGLDALSDQQVGGVVMLLVERLCLSAGCRSGAWRRSVTIRITYGPLSLAIVAAILAALLVSLSGVVTVSASWALGDRRLVPALDDAQFGAPPTLLEGRDPRTNSMVSAAGHFAAACASCQRRTGRCASPVMQKAMPPAPKLTELDPGKYSDRELFYILTHGIKMTGMPAWGSAEPRPDEVRRMVAFVRAQHGMTPGRYRALVEEAGRRGNGRHWRASPRARSRAAWPAAQTGAVAGRATSRCGGQSATWPARSTRITPPTGGRAR